MLRRLGFGTLLGIVLFVGFGARLAYVLGEATSDPMFALPIQDGAYYLEWAGAIAAGKAGPLWGHPAELPSAFYLAPLYPLVVAGFLKAFGENLALLYYLQQLLIVGAALSVAVGARRLAGDGAGLAAAALLLAYHPLLFFACRPVGEPLAIVLLTTGVVVFAGESRWHSAAGGLLLGFASLGRPNLLLVPGTWALVSGLQGHWRRGALCLAGAVLAVVPSLVRNYAASGHPVAVSSNGGMTLYNGNGPGAQGIGWFVDGMSGKPAEQQLQATRLASFYAERSLDPVEADRFWGRRALRVRLADAAGTIRLLGRRVALLVSNRELSVDYAPALDLRGWRWLGPLPFAALLGLAAAGVAARGLGRTGGTAVWGAVLALAAMPLVFFVSSRYRLPLAAMLAIPAGIGLAAILSKATAPRTRTFAAGVLAVVVLLSVLAPTGGLAETSEAAARAVRAAALLELGDPAKAEEELKVALELDPGSIPALNVLAKLYTGERSKEFQAFYDRALAVRSAGMNERWQTEILGLVGRGNLSAAWLSAESAASKGIELDPEIRGKLERAVRQPASAGGERR